MPDGRLPGADLPDIDAHDPLALPEGEVGMATVAPRDGPIAQPVAHAMTTNSPAIFELPLVEIPRETGRNAM